MLCPTSLRVASERYSTAHSPTSFRVVVDERVSGLNCDSRKDVPRPITRLSEPASSVSPIQNTVFGMESTSVAVPPDRGIRYTLVAYHCRALLIFRHSSEGSRVQ